MCSIDFRLQPFLEAAEIRPDFYRKKCLKPTSFRPENKKSQTENANVRPGDTWNHPKSK